MEAQNYWRKCSVCKKELPFEKIYYTCSVSTCNKQRAPHQFCSVTCWDVHNSVLLHRNAGADENCAPSKAQAQQLGEEGSRRRIIVSPKKENAEDSLETSEEVLVVVSKLKAYIKARADMNTSADVMPTLSDLLRRECDKAIEKARMSGRKTVMARDF